MGKIRTDSGPDKELADLAKELGQIAKHLFPLDPGRLAGHDRVLSCKAVMDLAAREGRENDLAACAAEAIPVAIVALSDIKDRLIAQAMFTVLDDYRGKQIGKRKELLEEAEGISPYTWDDRRNEVLHLVAYNLVHPEKVDSLVGEITPRTRVIPPLRGIALQAQRAVILHYAGMATLFARQFDQQLGGDIATLRTPSQSYFFNTYISLMYGPWFELAATPSGDVAIKQGYSDDLSDATLTRIEHLSHILDSSSPIGPTTNIENAAVRALHFMTHANAQTSASNNQVLAFNELLPDVDAYEWVDWQAVANEPPVDDSYPRSTQPKLMEIYNAWCRWLRADMSANEDGKEVVNIASASGALGALLGEHIDAYASLQKVAHSLAHKAIATYYDTPDYEPFSDGWSLRQHADAFFETKGPRLARMY